MQHLYHRRNFTLLLCWISLLFKCHSSRPADGPASRKLLTNPCPEGRQDALYSASALGCHRPTPVRAHAVEPAKFQRGFLHTKSSCPLENTYPNVKTRQITSYSNKLRGRNANRLIVKRL